MISTMKSLGIDQFSVAERILSWKRFGIVLPTMGKKPG